MKNIVILNSYQNIISADVVNTGGPAVDTMTGFFN